MSDQPTIPNALTPEEWAEAASDNAFTESQVQYGATWVDAIASPGNDRRHALAALALHGQPWGFTHADLHVLNDAIGNVYQIHGEWGVGPLDAEDGELAALRSLAARIEALLCPEGPTR